MLDQVIKFFIVFFVVVEPVSLLPLFVSLTEGANAAYCRRMARKAVILSGAILFLFALAGAVFLEAMGISLEAFRIFGGLLLFLIALEMVFARESGTRTSSREAAENRQRADISVFPLAFPFIAGPGRSRRSCFGSARCRSRRHLGTGRRCSQECLPFSCSPGSACGSPDR